MRFKNEWKTQIEINQYIFNFNNLEREQYKWNGLDPFCGHVCTTISHTRLTAHFSIFRTRVFKIKSESSPKLSHLYATKYEFINAAPVKRVSIHGEQST